MVKVEWNNQKDTSCAFICEREVNFFFYYAHIGVFTSEQGAAAAALPNDIRWLDDDWKEVGNNLVSSDVVQPVNNQIHGIGNHIWQTMV